MTSGKLDRSVCISIHDVAPATWPRCVRLIDAVRAVADVRLTLLVVPEYHGTPAPRPDSDFVAALQRHRDAGDELVLHGWRHLDEAPPPSSLRDYFLRRVHTAGEGEFAALTRNEAKARLESGLAWFARQGWNPEGFIAPAWLLGEPSWQALQELHFSYTATLRSLHLLPERVSFAYPVLAYSVRSALRRAVSRAYTGALLGRVRRAPAVRVALHPGDADHPQVVAHCQDIIADLLRTRDGLTKAQLAHRVRHAMIRVARYA